MKPAPFAYIAVDTVAEAVALLAEHGPDAKLLAGGQTLVPLMNLRLAQPSVLIDINSVPVRGVTRSRDGIAIGALTRQREIERSALVSDVAPLLADAVRYVGHPSTRSRGTVGGSVAHADPVAELPTVLLALEAEVDVVGQSGTKTFDINGFFRSEYTTLLRHDDFVTSLWVPSANAFGWGFREVGRRQREFPLVTAAAMVRVEAGHVAEARIALGGVGRVPMRLIDAEAAVVGGPATREAARTAAHVGASNLTPRSDVHAPASYRLAVARVLVERALVAAMTPNAIGDAYATS
jgi:carbon-monoxide dehydrogenase medium subunit